MFGHLVLAGIGSPDVAGRIQRHAVDEAEKQPSPQEVTNCPSRQWLDEFVSHLHTMRDHSIDRLNRIPGFQSKHPEGCYVAFADITATGHSSADIREILFKNAKVAVVPGLPEWFGPGAAGYIRLSFATSLAILDEALDRITLTIRNL